MPNTRSANRAFWGRTAEGAGHNTRNRGRLQSFEPTPVASRRLIAGREFWSRDRADQPSAADSWPAPAQAIVIFTRRA